MKRESSPLKIEHTKQSGNSASGIDGEITKRVEVLNRQNYLKRKGLGNSVERQLSLVFANVMDGREDKRHLPNDLARSSLFTTRGRKIKRQSMTQEKLFHYNEHISINFSGVELRAEDDELIWLQILNYGKSVQLGEPFEFTVNDLVKEVGWTKNGRNYDRARKCLSRLKATEIAVTNTAAYGHSGAISLISNYTSANDDKGQATHFRMWIDPNLIFLFAGNTFTSHSWEIYRTLSPVARRLADHIVSHKQPYPLNLERFKGMCGSSDSSIRSWRQTVRRACNEIVESLIATRATLDKSDLIVCIRPELPAPNKQLKLQ